MENEIKIIYECRDYLVCEKPCGVLSEDAQNGEKGLVGLLSEKYGEVHLLHRLDRGVSGVMVVARTKKAAAALSADIQNNRFFKEYLAVVEGCPEQTSGVYKDLLFKDSSKNRSYVVGRMRKGVKEASLEYTTIAGGERSLVRVLLHTGRTHQIRVQFSHRKTPLCGDKKYGGKDSGCDIALHSYRITFFDTESGEKVSFVSLPDFRKYPWNLFGGAELG